MVGKGLWNSFDLKTGNLF